MDTRLRITSSLSIDAHNLHYKAVRASGPGGQNVNKVASKIELWFDVVGCANLSDEIKVRLVNLAKNKIDNEGKLLITSQRTRDQKRNLDDALEKLRTLILRALAPPKRRRPTQPSRKSRQARLDQKRKQSQKKQGRTKAFLDHD